MQLSMTVSAPKYKLVCEWRYGKLADGSLTCVQSNSAIEKESFAPAPELDHTLYQVWTRGAE